MTKIDAHAHVFAPGARDVSPTLRPWAHVGDEAAMLAALDGAGVDRAVLAPLGSSGEYLRSVCERHPTRFRALGSVGDALDGPGLPAEFAGVRLATLHPARVGSAESSVLVQLHTAGCSVVSLFVEGAELGDLARQAAAVPAVDVVLNHLGAPRPAMLELDASGRPRLDRAALDAVQATVIALASHTNVHVVLSGLAALDDEPPYENVGPWIGDVLDAFGSERVMWGSDFPWIARSPGYAETLDAVHHHLGLRTSKERRDVLGETAARLFWTRSPAVVHGQATERNR